MKTVQVIVTGACALSFVWLLVLIVRNRTPDRRFLNFMIGVELLLLIHLVLGVVRVVTDGDGVAAWEYIAYLVGVALVVPVGVVWSSGEQSRGGTAVLLIAMLVVPFMFVRLGDIWAAGA